MKTQKLKFKAGDAVSHLVDYRRMIIIGLEEKRHVTVKVGQKPITVIEFIGYRCRYLNYLKEYTTSIFNESELKLSK